MTDNVTLDRIDFEKRKEQAKMARAEYMRRYWQGMGLFMRAYHVIAVVAVLLVSFGVKMFFLSPKCPSASSSARR